MTPVELVQAAREVLGDEPLPYRVANSFLLRALNDAMRQVWEHHPDARILDDGTARAFTSVLVVEETVPTDDVVLADRWKPVLVDYMCYRGFLRGGEDDENRARAREHLTLYEQGLGTWRS